jgi:RNA polymerase sigma factor (sigma-70 family)
MEYSDIDVIQKVLKGELALFEILIRRYNAALYKTGRSYNYSHEDTQDLMQETLVDAYTHLSKFENRSSFKTWLLRIMLNNCFRRKEKFSVKNEVSAVIDDKSIPMFSNDHADTTRIVVNRELSFVIENALLRIPLDYRMVFSLREINGLNVHETSEVLSITETSVKVRLSRAKTMLRKEIEKDYTTEDIFEFNLIHCDAMVNRIMKVIENGAAPKTV